MENKGDNKEKNKEILVNLRKEMGMSRKEFCQYFEIPYRTMQDWELGNRSIPDYLLRLMTYKAKMDVLTKKKKKGADENEKG
ncbi:MAG: transcriptional regulator [Acetatifactor sp.]|nr:transcriptional regulator [Acetatifactor sp.]